MQYGIRQHVCALNHLEGNILDLILTQNDDAHSKLVSLQAVTSACFSDHRLINCRLGVDQNVSPSRPKSVAQSVCCPDDRILACRALATASRDREPTTSGTNSQLRLTTRGSPVELFSAYCTRTARSSITTQIARSWPQRSSGSLSTRSILYAPM